MEGLERSGRMEISLDGIANVPLNPPVHAAYVGPDPHSGLSTLTSTVAEELALHRTLALCTSGSNYPDFSTETADRLGLDSLANRDPMGLSGGQAAALGLACALALGRPVLAVDEGLAQLDTSLREVAWGILRRYSERGHLVLVAENHYGLMAEHADRTLLMDEGLATDGEIGTAAFASERVVALGTIPPVTALAAKLGIDRGRLPDRYASLLSELRSRGLKPLDVMVSNAD